PDQRANNCDREMHRRKRSLDGHGVEAFAPNACLFDWAAQHKYRHVSSECGWEIVTSGWWDLNPRPVAAATALLSPIELISTSAGLVVSLALRCFRTSGKTFAADQNPRHAMLRRFGLTGVVTTNSFSQILARTDVAPSGFLAAQYVTVKHF